VSTDRVAEATAPARQGRKEQQGDSPDAGSGSPRGVWRSISWLCGSAAPREAILCGSAALREAMLCGLCILWGSYPEFVPDPDPLIDYRGMISPSIRRRSRTTSSETAWPRSAR